MRSSLFSNFTLLICILRACGDLSCDHNVARFGTAPSSSHLDFAFGLRSQGLVIAEGNLHSSARARSNRGLYVVTGRVARPRCWRAGLLTSPMVVDGWPKRNPVDDFGCPVLGL